MDADRLDATFAALADPTRRAILARLARGSASVKELSEPFTISAPAITKHLKVLERAGLVVRAREAQLRPCTLDARPLSDAADWIARYREIWERRLDRLDDYLRELQAAATKPARTPATGDIDAKSRPKRRGTNGRRRRSR
jgi:DNA-binding transcriptional ArsR family regulator